MISAEITKSAFITSVLERDLINIYSAMELIAKRNIYVEGKQLQQRKRRGAGIGIRTGSLLRSLEAPKYSISASAGKFIVIADIVLHTRFLDMKKYGNRRIYNRQLWGILYKNALPDIKYRYGMAIKNYVGEELRSAFSDRDTKTIAKNLHLSI